MLEEQGRMKEDMITLAQQLQEAEERLLEALEVNKQHVASSINAHIHAHTHTPAAASSAAKRQRRGGGGQEEEENEKEKEMEKLRAALAAKEIELADLKGAIWRLKEECVVAMQQEEETEAAAAAAAGALTHQRRAAAPGGGGGHTHTHTHTTSTYTNKKNSSRTSATRCVSSSSAWPKHASTWTSVERSKRRPSTHKNKRRLRKRISLSR